MGTEISTEMGAELRIGAATAAKPWNRVAVHRLNGVRSMLELQELDTFVPIELTMRLPYGSMDVPGRAYTVGIWSGARVDDQQMFWTVSVGTTLYQLLLTYDGSYRDTTPGSQPQLQDAEVLVDKRSVLKVSLADDGTATFSNNMGWLYELPVDESGNRTLTSELVDHIDPELQLLLDSNLQRALANWFHGLQPTDATTYGVPLLVVLLAAACCVKVKTGHTGKRDEDRYWEASLNCTCLDSK
ncbi:hypothetical protein [Geodermatophilus maliterrae]|uniref:Uncharacterized protein n=1 Tax=Geodermatophilus maliterrae TaxID=3162531 RepID=A0ABV3XPA8_9ACTN